MARAGVARAGASRFASSREEDGTVAEARDGGAGDGAGVGLPDDAGATLLDGVPAAAFFCGFTGLNFEVDLAGKSASEQAIPCDRQHGADSPRRDDIVQCCVDAVT